jgi:glycosyltransferase involved in cell wall biosynthesis
MRVGLNAALMSSRGGYRQTGVSRYIRELLTALGPELEPGESVIPLGAGHPAISERPPLRIAWEQTVLPVEARLRRLDLLHGPLHVAPFISLTPAVITVHDLAFLKYPDRVPRSRRLYLTPGTRRSALRARKVIAISTSTANDLMAWLELPASMIEVIPLAPTASIQHITGPALDTFRQNADITRPYLLTVGTLEPRKNLSTLLRAFAALAPEIPHDLVLVGPEGWLNEGLGETVRALGLADRVRLTGFVSDEDLSGWYSAADCFVFPSVYEGFGLPPLEAMRCGAPVVTTNVSSLPDVVGDAAITVDPFDAEALAAAMRRVISDQALAEELCARGIARAAEFSWARTARETLAVYREAAR